MDAMKWIDEVRGTDSLRAAARRAGITSQKLIRQVNDNQLTFETVRDVSRAYGRAVLADLIALGHLTSADAGVEGLERVLQTATDAELVREVARRMDGVTGSMYWDSPASEAIERAENVTRLDDHRLQDREPDHRAVASESEDEGNDDDSGFDA